MIALRAGRRALSRARRERHPLEVERDSRTPRQLRRGSRTDPAAGVARCACRPRETAASRGGKSRRMPLSAHDRKGEVSVFSRSDAARDLASPKQHTWGPHGHGCAPIGRTC